MNFFKKPTYIFIIIILIGVAAFTLAPKQSKVDENNRTAQTTKHTAYLKIKTDNNENVFPEIEITETTTALELTQNLASVSASGEGVNTFITEINGRQADNNKKEFWELLVNGKPSEVGAGSYIIKPNDQLEWRISNF